MSVSYPDETKPCGKPNLLNYEGCISCCKLPVLKGVPLAAAVNVYLSPGSFSHAVFGGSQQRLIKINLPLMTLFIRTVYCLRFTTHVLKGIPGLLNKQKLKGLCSSH